MLDIEPHTEPIVHLVRQWVIKAENDLQNVTSILILTTSS